MCFRIDLVPYSTERYQFIATECPERTCARTHACHPGEVQDDERKDCEGDPACTTEDVVEDLRYWLLDGTLEDATLTEDVARTIAQHNGKEPAANVSEAKCKCNSPRCFDLWPLDLFGDVRSRVVVRHSPTSGQEAEQKGEACR